MDAAVESFQIDQTVTAAGFAGMPAMKFQV